MIDDVKRSEIGVDVEKNPSVMGVDGRSAPQNVE